MSERSPRPDEGHEASGADPGDLESLEAYEYSGDDLMALIRKSVADRDTASLAPLHDLVREPRRLRAADRSWLPSALARALALAEHAIELPDPDPAADADLALRLTAVTGDSLPEADSVTVPVLFGRNMFGAVGTIRLRRLRSGPPGLHPDPEVMTLRFFDPDFLDAVHQAWALRPIPGAAVLWSVEVEDLDRYQGGSLGSAFAFGLDELRRRGKRFGRLRSRLRGANNRWVVSASLAADGRLVGVTEIRQKIEAAAAAKKRVVLSAQDRTLGDSAAANAGTKVAYAETLPEAFRIARRPTPVYLGTVITTVALVLAMGIGGCVLNRFETQANHRAHARDLLDKATALQTLAAKTGANSVSDLQTQSLLLLAARSLALEAGRTDVADRILDTAPAFGPGVVGTAHDDLGDLASMQVIGDNVLVGSDKGDLALYDGSNNDLLGQYTEPPGVEALYQPQMTAFAADPQARMFATVFQVPYGVDGLSTEARLRVFSATRTLHLVGSSSSFTSERVLAMGYEPQGGELITVSDDTATFFDMTRSTPTVIGRCALPGGKARFIGVYDDPASHRPDLIADDTSVLRLASWQPPHGDGPCGSVAIVPPWAQSIVKDQTGLLVIATGSRSDGTVLVAAATGTGKVSVRTLDGSETATLDSPSPVDGIGPPGDGLEVSSSSGAHKSLTTWDLTTLTAPIKRATYGGLGLPAVDTGAGAFATAAGRIVTRVNDEATSYPAGSVVLGPQAQVNGIAAGKNSFALVYGKIGIAVYTLSTRPQATFITFPTKSSLAPGAYRTDATLAMSDDDRYLAAVVAPEAEPSSARNPRTLLVWDTTTGMPTAVSAPFDVAGGSAEPLDVRFLPNSDSLLVDTAKGVLYRLTLKAGTWEPDILRTAAAGSTTFGLDVGPRGIFLFEVEPPAGGTRRDHVLLLASDGSTRESWDYTSLNIADAQVTPLSDGEALLIDNAGKAYRLGTNGSVGPAVTLNAGNVVEAEQIPGTQTVLIATERLSREYDLAGNLVTPAKVPAGIILSFALSSDGGYLAGADVLDQRAFFAALRPQEKAANLCTTAGRELTRQEWSAYVGDVAGYRTLCASDDGALAAMYGLARQGLFLSSPRIVRTPSVSEASRFQSACTGPAQAGYQTSGPFSWKDGADSTVICVSGVPRWIIPPTRGLQINPGTVGGQPILAVSGGQSTTALDILGTTALDISTSSVSGIVDVTGDGVSLTGVHGDVVLATTYAPDSRGYWGAVSVVPLGSPPLGTLS